MQTTILSEELVTSFVHRFKDVPFIPTNEYIDWALYDPKIGYYRQQRQRVGKSSKADFYTSSSFSEIWPTLIVECCTQLLFPDSPANYDFVEIAAEPSSSLLQDYPHPFSSNYVIRLGDKIDIPKKAIVYSNEWLDALPFKRYSYSSERNAWLEHGVALQGQTIMEIRSEDPLEKSSHLPFQKYRNLPNRYIVDWPSKALEDLTNLMSSKDWEGLFLTFDYGLNTDELFQNRPNGTARAYKNHELRNDIFAFPGEQDITCHLCWDQMIGILKKESFQNIALSSQESFLIHYAKKALQTNVEQGNLAQISAIKELIHPQYMGQKFQVLHGLRGQTGV